MDKKIGVTALVFGIISLLAPMLLNMQISTSIAVLGLISGIGGVKTEGKGLAIGGIVTSAISIAISIIFSVVSLTMAIFLN